MNTDHCRGEKKRGSGCARGEDCTGHGNIDCMMCGWPIAQHPWPGFNHAPKHQWREPRARKVRYHNT